MRGASLVGLVGLVVAVAAAAPIADLVAAAVVAGDDGVVVALGAGRWDDAVAGNCGLVFVVPDGEEWTIAGVAGGRTVWGPCRGSRMAQFRLGAGAVVEVANVVFEGGNAGGLPTVDLAAMQRRLEARAAARVAVAVRGSDRSAGRRERGPRWVTGGTPALAERLRALAAEVLALAGAREEVEVFIEVLTGELRDRGVRGHVSERGRVGRREGFPGTPTLGAAAGPCCGRSRRALCQSQSQHRQVWGTRGGAC